MSDSLRGRGARIAPVVTAALLALTVSSSPLAAQSTVATLRVQENVRAEPNGLVVAVLEPGAEVRVVSRRDRWLEVDVEGWVWMRSLQATTRPDLDLVVSEAGGENLRDAPSGEVMGRLDEGTLLEERERTPGWIRARRRGWLWAASADVAETAAAPAAQPTPGNGDGGVASSAAPSAAEPQVGQVHRVRPAGAPVLASPDGDTLAVARGGVELPRRGREGGWVRVRIDGWIWHPDADTTAAPEASDATPAQVAAAGDAHRGRLVTWELQFVSRERAEKVRTDFYEGEPFLLTRHADGPFVYVAVPPDRLAEVDGLVALERLTVVGRVRVGASDLTGSPILDLVELRRAPRR